MIDLLLIGLIISYCIYIIINKLKAKKGSDCSHSCCSCRGCQETKNIKQLYYQDSLVKGKK